MYPMCPIRRCLLLVTAAILSACGGSVTDKPGCSSESLCSASAGGCCEATCVPSAVGPTDCQTCGLNCSATQFCGTSACVPYQLPSLCEYPRLGIVVGGSTGDDTAARVVKDALAGACSGSTVVELTQSDTTVAADASGEPLTGPGTTLVVIGGSFRRPIVRYLEKQGLTPIEFRESNGGAEFTISVPSADGSTITFTGRPDDITSSTDFFAVQLARHPGNGSLIFSIWGIKQGGTSAGAWYFANIIVPQLADPGNAMRWLLIKWTDDDGLTGPSSEDKWQELAQGL